MIQSTNNAAITTAVVVVGLILNGKLLSVFGDWFWHVVIFGRAVTIGGEFDIVEFIQEIALDTFA